MSYLRDFFLSSGGYWQREDDPKAVLNVLEKEDYSDGTLNYGKGSRERRQHKKGV